MTVATTLEAADTALGQPVRAGILKARDEIAALKGEEYPTGRPWDRADSPGAMAREIAMGAADPESPAWMFFAAFVGTAAEVTGDVGTVVGGAKMAATSAGDLARWVRWNRLLKQGALDDALLALERANSAADREAAFEQIRKVMNADEQAELARRVATGTPSPDASLPPRVPEAPPQGPPAGGGAAGPEPMTPGSGVDSLGRKDRSNGSLEAEAKTPGSGVEGAGRTGAELGLRFGEDDLVFGPTGPDRNLRKLADEAGGKTLNDLVKPTELTWIEFSIQMMERQVAIGGKIRFDLTCADDIHGMLNGTGKYADTVTAAELRHIKANWARYEDHVHFYRCGQEVGKPW